MRAFIHTIRVTTPSGYLRDYDMKFARTPLPKTDRALVLMHDVVRQARSAVLWVRDNVTAAADAGLLSAEDTQEIWDHADEAEETLLRSLDTLHPELKALGDDAATKFEEFAQDLGGPRPRAQRRRLVEQLYETLEEALEHVGQAAPYGVGALSDPETGFSSEEIERLWRDFADARESVEAALHTLDPERFSSELRRLSDVERISRAAEIEQIELRREIVSRAGNP